MSNLFSQCQFGPAHSLGDLNLHVTPYGWARAKAAFLTTGDPKKAAAVQRQFLRRTVDLWQAPSLTRYLLTTFQ